MSSRFGNNALWAFGGVVAQGAFRVVTNVLIGRHAGALVLGQAAGVLALAQLLTLLGPTSLSAALTRYLAIPLREGEDPNHFRAALTRHVRWRVVQASVLVAAAGAIWSMLLGRPLEQVVLVVVLTVALIGYSFTKAHLLGLHRVVKVSWLEIVTAAVGVSLVGALLFSGMRSIILLWPVAFVALVFAVTAWPMPARARLSAPIRREVDRFALLGIVGTFVSAGFLQASVLVAADVVGGRSGGHYAAAMALATPLALVAMSMGLVLFPSFSAAIQDQRRTTDLLAESLDIVMVVLFPLVSLVMLLAPEVVSIVWGNAFAESSGVLPLLAGAVLFMGLGTPASQALTATGLQGMRSSVLIGVGGLAVGLLVWVLAVPTWGILGIALGYAIGTAINSATPLVLVSRQLGLRWRGPLLRGWGTAGLLMGVTTQLVVADVGLVVRASLALGLALVWIAWQRDAIRKLIRRR